MLKNDHHSDMTSM